MSEVAVEVSEQAANGYKLSFTVPSASVSF